MCSRAEALFTDALARPAEQRAAFLAAACEGDTRLQARVSELLAAHETPETLGLAQLVAGCVARFEEKPGDVIGRYRLREKIGEGGCGVVFMAEQEQPVRRRVALKVIKAGMDTREVIARFSAERQALALMDHPGIAKVFDAGATDAGRPYFVMELVRGLPITKYCDEQRLSLSARLQLFLQVCDAVQHAHQKGIVHRDLKPSNVLVALSGATAVPTVIDFGIAKADSGRLTDATLFTARDQFIGTPAYMSPEQAELGGIDVDTRSDVYALGVLLYELLAGCPPFEPKELARVSRDEMRRIIREVEPPRPSARFRALGGEERASLAQRRGVDPLRLQTTLAGDLDWIVVKALEKDRSRRYESPAALAADLGRHLKHEPVSARPPGKLYLFGKLVRRNRLTFAAAAAIALTLVAGTIVSVRQAVRATRAERLASVERSRAVDARARAEDLLNFMLGDLRSEVKRLGRLDLLEMVGDKAMTYFAQLDPRDLQDGALAGQAKTLSQLADVRMAQTRYPEAQRSYQAAYDRLRALTARNPQDADVLFLRGQAEWGVGFVHWKRGELDAANEWLERYRDTCAALVAFDATDRRWQSELAWGQHNLAVLAMERGNLTAARDDFLAELSALNRLLESAPADAELKLRVADVTSFLGSVAERSGDLPEALRRFSDTVAQLGALAAADPQRAHTRFRLADSLAFQADLLARTGRRSEAEQAVARARGLMEALSAHDPSNRHWRIALLNLRLKEAMLAHVDGRTDAALPLATETRRGLEELAAAEPSDRKCASKLSLALRLEAELRHSAGEPDAFALAARAVEGAETLVREGRAISNDIAELAQACVIAGRIASAHNDAATALTHWRRARDVLAPQLAKTRDWRLLEPASRVAALLGEPDHARALVARLIGSGYVPLDSHPEAALLSAHTQSSAQARDPR